MICKFFQQGHCRYGQNCRFEHIYGSKYTYRAPQSHNEKSSEQMFENSMRQGTSHNVASSVFRSAVQNNPVFSSVPNYEQNSQSKGSVFNRLGPQNPTVSFQSNQAKSIFAQANQTFGQPVQTRNVFFTQNQEAAKSIFAQASRNIYGPTQTMDTFKPTKDTAASLFASAAQSLHHNDPFKQEAHSPFSNNTQNIFQISERPISNVFGVIGNTFEQSNNEEGIYSNSEELSKSDLDAFESEDFKLGYIPELPPPRSLCI